MCVCTENYEPAHPHFSHIYLQNEEQIENPQKEQKIINYIQNFMSIW